MYSLTKIEKNFKNYLIRLDIDDDGKLPFWDNYVVYKNCCKSTRYTVDSYMSWLQDEYFRYSGKMLSGCTNCSFAESIEEAYPTE
jgi:hypothetical protein